MKLEIEISLDDLAKTLLYYETMENIICHSIPKNEKENIVNKLINQKDYAIHIIKKIIGNNLSKDLLNKLFDKYPLDTLRNFDCKNVLPDKLFKYIKKDIWSIHYYQIPSTNISNEVKLKLTDYIIKSKKITSDDILSLQKYLAPLTLKQQDYIICKKHNKFDNLSAATLKKLGFDKVMIKKFNESRTVKDIIC